MQSEWKPLTFFSHVINPLAVPSFQQPYTVARTFYTMDPCTECIMTNQLAERGYAHYIYFVGFLCLLM
jgi:hypothetical protein